MPTRTQSSKAYRLSFGGTRAVKWAPTKAAALADARYWIGYGQMRVCIDRRLPSGSFTRVKCLYRAGARRRRAAR